MSISQPTHVTICSPFRDSEAIIDAYMDRLIRMQVEAMPVRFRRIFVEGDSVDDTWRKLMTWATNDISTKFVKCDTGAPHYGSVVDPERFRTLATVFNAALDAVDLEWSDYVLFLPCDIHYKPDLLQRLIAHDVDVVAPLVWSEGVFYDTWAVGKDGQYFHKFTPEEAKQMFGEGLTEMDTVGGVVLIKASVLRSGCRYTSTEVDRGLCNMAKSKGFRVWLDSSTHVYHPPLPSDVSIMLSENHHTNCRMGNIEHNG